MKNRFIALIALAVFALISSGNVFAQSASVTATATVLVPITATAMSPLAFGTVTRGSTTTVAATATNAAEVSFSGDESDQITVTLPGTATISTSSGSGANMTVTINRASLRYTPLGNIPSNGAATVDASSGSATVGLSMDNQGDAVNNDGLGQAYIWIGGSVSPSASQQRGSYTGTFTVSAVYAN